MEGNWEIFLYFKSLESLSSALNIPIVKSVTFWFDYANWSQNSRILSFSSEGLWYKTNTSLKLFKTILLKLLFTIIFTGSLLVSGSSSDLAFFGFVMPREIYSAKSLRVLGVCFEGDIGLLTTWLPLGTYPIRMGNSSFFTSKTSSC